MPLDHGYDTRLWNRDLLAPPLPRRHLVLIYLQASLRLPGLTLKPVRLVPLSLGLVPSGRYGFMVLPLLSTCVCIHWVHSSPMKDVGLRIRLQRELREHFIAVYKSQDKSAAQVLREFMRSYIE